VKRFQFKLEPVLNYRKLLEEGEEQKLKVIYAALLEAHRTREELQLKIERSCQLLAERNQGTIDIDSVRNLIAYIDRLRHDLIRAVHAVAKLEQDRSVQLAKLLEARKRREIVEKLKENSLSAHMKESRALEQKLLDELSVTQFGRLIVQDLPDAKSDS
jgi:flagellar protein FliJ